MYYVSSGCCLAARGCWVFVIALALVVGAPAQSPPPVPSVYQDLFSSAQSQISAFDQTVLQSWNKTKGPVAFGAQVGTANSNQGPTLLTSGNAGAVITELRLLQALGVKAVNIHIGYPILDPGFDAYGGQYANYLAFYQQVVSDVRACGLKLIVEASPIPTDALYSNINPMAYFNSMTTAQYDLGRANQALLIAQKLSPDYLSVIEEPDSEATESGKSELGTVSGSTTLLNQILSVYRQPGGPTVPIGAGVGTWINSYNQYIQSFVATSIDFVDMHIYPVNKDYLTRAITIAGIASGAGKRLAMSECWFEKIRDTELSSLTLDVVRSRNDFSFWSPLDTQFLQAIVDFSYYQNLLFAAPFWEEFFFAYVDYNSTTSAMTISALNAAASTAETAAFQLPSYTATGHGWENSILLTPDTTPPSPPVLSSGTVYAHSVTINWGQAPDNVGTAGYSLYRNGTLLLQTSGFTYYDSTLSDGTTYKYTATAVDAAGNESALSASLPVTTPDVTPPTTPTNFKVTLAGPTQINLSWTASTDNVGVKQYLIYRGKAGAAPTGFAIIPGTSYQNTNLASLTSFCYYVEAQDAALNISPPTPTVCATTADTIPPSTPNGVTASATSSTQVKVSWNPSTDDGTVTGYKIERIQGTQTLIVGSSPTPGYLDKTVVPNTTYYYGVMAYDAAGNQSYISAAAKVTTPAH
jgi:fibronectin type 3 domain-containing protein